MGKVTLRAHFDGEQIQLDEPFKLEPDTPLTVIVGGRDEGSQERADWLLFASEALERAYGEDEPEYSLDLIKEPNPDYEGG
jgi:hypothetical protein